MNFIKKLNAVFILIVCSLIILTCYMTWYQNFCKAYKKHSISVKISTVGQENATNFVTIVCIYFQIYKSKHSNSKYHAWIENMLKSVTAPLVIYTDSNQTHIQNLITSSNLTATIIKANSVWDLMAELEKYRNEQYIDNYVNQQIKMDPEGRIHSPELYAIWNLKTYLTYNVSLHNPYKSEFFIYTDMGAWRGKRFHDWPNVPFVKNLTTKLNDRILYGQINEIDSNQQIELSNDLIEGTFFAGSKKALAELVESYYEIHDEFLINGMYLGKDQRIMNYLAFYSSQYLIVRLKTINLKCLVPYDRWFFYQYYLAVDDEYICAEDRLSILYEK